MNSSVFFLLSGKKANHLDTCKRLTNKASKKEVERPQSASPARSARGPKEGLELKFAFG